MSKANPKPPPNGRRIVSKDYIRDFFENNNNIGKSIIYIIKIERCDGQPDRLYQCSTVYEVFRQIKVRGRECVSRMLIACVTTKQAMNEFYSKYEFITVWEGNEEMKHLRALYEL